ncbi:MAG: TadE/TadG family type IV pilus assembly protein, partial [Rhodoblastus sp.]
ADDNRRRRERGLSAFAQNQSGNIMVLATLLAVPVSGAVGLAVDYGRALYAKQQLDSAASAAASTAANSARFAFQQKGGNVEQEDDDAANEGKRRGAKAFGVQSALRPAGATMVRNPTVTVKRVGAVLTSNVQYNAALPSTLGGLFGIKKINISGTAVANATVMQVPSQDYIIKESFELVPTPMYQGNGTWDVYKNYNGWTTAGSGVEVDAKCAILCGDPPDGLNHGELDSHGNSAMSKKVFLPVGAYELRYWYYGRNNNVAFNPVWVCGSTDADVEWSTDGGAALSNRIGVYLDQSSSDTAALAWSEAKSGYVGSNLIDTCTWSGKKWIERSIKINIVSPGEYWLSFSALGRNDTYGGLLDDIRLCPVACKESLHENFPWAANTVLFTDDFSTPQYPAAGSASTPPAGPGDYGSTKLATLDKSGSVQNSAWETAPGEGWVTAPVNQMDFISSAVAGLTSGNLLEMDATLGNRTIFRKFNLDPGYYSISWKYISRAYMKNEITTTVCGASPEDVNASVYATKLSTTNERFPTSVLAESVKGINKKQDTNLVSFYIDDNRSYAHPVGSADYYGVTTYANPNGTATNGTFASLPQNVFDSCLYSPTLATRTVKFRIDKPGAYWLSWRAEGSSDNYGGGLGNVVLTALGGLSMASKPSPLAVVPTSAPTTGETVTLGGYYIAAQ